MAVRWPGVYPDRGLFVCFEGGEGAGKSTQSRALDDRLRAAGYSVLLTREPGGTEVGARIREIVLSPGTGELDHRTEALLYAADKAEHVASVVLPALAEGQVVITDRYVDSTLAYQGAGRDLDPVELAEVSRWATGDLRPDLTVLLDVDPQAGFSRFAERDRIEQLPPDFHRRVREGFRTLAAENPGHYLVLDGREEVSVLSARIWETVSGLLGKAARPAGRSDRQTEHENGQEGASR